MNDVFPYSLLKDNHDSSVYLKVIRLMSCNEKMRCLKVKRLSRYHVLIRYKFPKKKKKMLIICFLFSIFLEQKERRGIALSYQCMLAEEGILEIFNLNEQKFGPYGDLVNEAFANYNSNLPVNQDAYGQVEEMRKQLRLFIMKILRKNKIKVMVLVQYLG